MVAETSGIGASAAAIQHHYDVGNGFYELWLDETLTYSCGLWLDAQDLRTAQDNKLDWHLSRCGDLRGARLLDVGCGWGSLLRRAVECYDVESATGLSLSAAQVSRCNALGLHKARARLESWAEHQPESPYNAIVSIGAFEHFARLDQLPGQKLAAYRAFFEFCHRTLEENGRLCLQTITYEDADRAKFSAFFAEEIFPESDLPHLEEIVTAARERFELVELRMDRDDYARTARVWLTRLRACRAQAAARASVQTVRTYETYLGLLVAGFHTGAMNLARMVMRRKVSRRGSCLRHGRRALPGDGQGVDAAPTDVCR